MRKILVVITARPSYSRIKSVLISLNKIKSVNLIIVIAHGAALDKYGNLKNIIEKDGLTVHSVLYSLVEGENTLTSGLSTGLSIIELSNLFSTIKPDIVVTIADRYETIATAISASYLNIPLAHIQGGEVTGNIDEKVRHSITKLSDYHFVSSPLAKERVLRLGENPQYVFLTGCPSIDLVKEVLQNPKKISLTDIKGVGNLTNNSNYSIVLNHPDTNELYSAADQINSIYEGLNHYKGQIFWFWPNVDAGSDITSKAIRGLREKYNPKNILFVKNLEPEIFLNLLKETDFIIGNSSVGIRESSFLGTASINLGNRQIGRERGNNVFDLPYESNIIAQQVNSILDGKYHKVVSNLYGDGFAGERIAKLLSEIDLIHSKILNY